MEKRYVWLIKLFVFNRIFSGGEEDWGKVAWVSWDDVCLPKDKGSLEVKHIKAFNHALLGKWRWRVQNNCKGLWVKVLPSKYRWASNLVFNTSTKEESV